MIALAPCCTVPRCAVSNKGCQYSNGRGKHHRPSFPLPLAVSTELVPAVPVSSRLTPFVLVSVPGPFCFVYHCLRLVQLSLHLVSSGPVSSNTVSSESWSVSKVLSRPVPHLHIPSRPPCPALPIDSARSRTQGNRIAVAIFPTSATPPPHWGPM